MGKWERLKNEVRYGAAATPKGPSTPPAAAMPPPSGQPVAMAPPSASPPPAAPAPPATAPVGSTREFPGWAPTLLPAAVEPTTAALPVVGVRTYARKLQAEVDRLTAVATEQHSQLGRLGALEIVELERQRDALGVANEAERRRQEVDRYHAVTKLREELAAVRAADEQRAQELRTDVARLAAEQTRFERLVVRTRDEQLLQEVGVYEFRHPLDDAEAYKGQLQSVRARVKQMAKVNGGAVTGAMGWTVNGSKTEGQRMVREFSKLMLRAYNAEVDALVRGLKPYKLAGAVDRLGKSRDTIAKLGQTMSIQISAQYHRLRIEELELTADYQEKVAQEKEREREEKARMREERKAQQEMQRERERLEKERQHYANALAALDAKGDEEAAGKLRSQVDELNRAIEDVDYRVANIRAGYVYVISNIGAFGERMIKIGMTRRLEPLDRVRELGDASVPFRFDVHALFFAEDAVGIEQAMHQRFSDRRVNMVNLRREFFYATPQEARAHLLELAGDLLEYVEVPEALEFHQSAPDRVAQLDEATAPG